VNRPEENEGKTEITRHEVTFDVSGFIAERRYQDYWGTPRHDAQGSFGARYLYSAGGLAVRRSEIGPDGEETTLKNGVRALVSSYDGQLRLVRQTLLGEHDQPIIGPEGFAYYTRE